MLEISKVKEYGLDDWVKEFDDIYGNVNENRSIEQIWLHAIEHASALHENLRIGAYERAFDDISDIFCWLCALTVKAHRELNTRESLLDIVLSKYPRICFYCGSEHCICSQKVGRGIEDPEQKKQLREASLANVKIMRKVHHDQRDEPKSLQDVALMFFELYDHINFRTPLEIIVAHFQEEVGEVATCLNNFVDHPDTINGHEHLLELEHEIADVITWMVALYWKLDYLLAAGVIYQEKQSGNTAKRKRSLGVPLSEIIWQYFKTPDGKTLWCPNCKDRPCRLEIARSK